RRVGGRDGGNAADTPGGAAGEPDRAAGGVGGVLLPQPGLGLQPRAGLGAVLPVAGAGVRADGDDVAGAGDGDDVRFDARGAGGRVQLRVRVGGVRGAVGRGGAGVAVLPDDARIGRGQGRPVRVLCAAVGHAAVGAGGRA